VRLDPRARLDCASTILWSIVPASSTLADEPIVAFSARTTTWREGAPITPPAAA
jgi:hypothetical protein